MQLFDNRSLPPFSIFTTILTKQLINRQTNQSLISICYFINNIIKIWQVRSLSTDKAFTTSISGMVDRAVSLSSELRKVKQSIDFTLIRH